MSKNREARKRVISFEYKPSSTEEIVLSSLTYAASKIWNIANYERKNWQPKMGAYPDWYEQKKRLKEEFWYKNLPSQSAQEVLKQLEEAWKSYKELKRTQGVKNPKPPRYKHKNFNVRYLNNGFKIERNIIRLSIPKKQKEYIKDRHGLKVKFMYIPIPDEYKGYKGNTKIIEIIPVPACNRYRVNIIVELPKLQFKKENGIYMSVDLGINNLITCYVSTGKSMIISGRQILSINRYFDKTINHYQSIAYVEQIASGKKHPEKTKRIKKLYTKRRKQIQHILHSATKKVIDFAKEENVSYIIIGDITNIRDNNNMGRKNNQKFHKWPFKRILNMLWYKAEDCKIQVEKQEESYTSQCSPYEDEVSEYTAKKARRICRGLYAVDKKLL